MRKKNKLNNKGYMLIEIVLASVIAFGLAYFMLELTLKLKNKNDDLMVETLISTDNAIISNAIMKKLKENSEDFDCSKITVNDKKVYIDGEFITEINKYATIDIDSCSSQLELENTRKHIMIPLKITQNDKNYDIDLYYKLS